LNLVQHCANDRLLAIPDSDMNEVQQRLGDLLTNGRISFHKRVEVANTSNGTYRTENQSRGVPLPWH
jgi:hypothetical protein